MLVGDLSVSFIAPIKFVILSGIGEPAPVGLVGMGGGRGVTGARSSFVDEDVFAG